MCKQVFLKLRLTGAAFLVEQGSIKILLKCYEPVVILRLHFPNLAR